MYGNQQPAEEEEEKETDETKKRESNNFVSISCYSKDTDGQINFFYIDNYSELPFFDIIKPPPSI